MKILSRFSARTWAVVFGSGFLVGHKVAFADSPEPPFVLGGSRYDETTYTGRLRQIMEVISPKTLLVSDTELKRCRHLIAKYEETGGVLPHGVSDAEMWKAQTTVNAIIHAPTGEKMFAPGRMSAFVPVNVPLVIGMLMHGPTSTAANVFWQWANQTYNVVNNYTCRAGPQVDSTALGQAYALAVTASIGIALGAGRLLAAKPHLQKFGPFVPYFAVITAGACNVSFTRMDEILNGINVSDADGNVLGRSISAGRLAVFKTVTTRSIFLPVFPLLIPPATMKFLYSAKLLMPKTALSAMIEVAVITMAMGGALPLALAMQPQIMTIDPTSLEPEFQNLKDSNGNPITEVYASKGL